MGRDMLLFFVFTSIILTANAELWVNKHTGTWRSLEQECYLDSYPYSHLVTLDTRGKNDCLIKYLQDEYGGPWKRYAIGLKSPDAYRGVYEWREDNKTLDFVNWANSFPKDNPYVYM